MIVLDSNVLLEILEHRKRYDETLETLAGYGDKYTQAITTLTVSNVFYIAERANIDFANIENLVSAYQHLDITAADVRWALDHYQCDDFEDALQVASAVRSGCSHFITLDGQLSKKYADYLTIQLIR